MAIATPIRLAQAALSTTLTTVLHTAGTKEIVREIFLSNTSASAVPVTIRAGASNGVAETLIPAASVSANGFLQVSLNLVLNAGDTISGGAATGAAVGCSISGLTIV